MSGFNCDVCGQGDYCLCSGRMPEAWRGKMPSLPDAISMTGLIKLIQERDELRAKNAQLNKEIVRLNNQAMNLIESLRIENEASVRLREENRELKEREARK